MSKKQTRIKALIIPAVFALAFIFAPEAQAEDHYVDCSRSTNGNGTYASPWNSISYADQHAMNPGDDVYFKVGTTCKLNSHLDRLKVNWSGIATNRVIVGAYYGNGLFGLNGNPRPIISGQQVYPTNYQGVIEVVNQSYVTVKDLKVTNAGDSAATAPNAIKITDSSNINVDNCHLYRSSGNSILYARVNTGTISNNIVEESGYPNYSDVGAAMEITAGNIDGATTKILVTRNKVFNSKHEGIGLYKNVTHSIVEYNIVRDIRSFFYYNGSSKWNIWRYNIAYETEDSPHPSFEDKRSSYAFASDIEEWRTGERFNGECEWYGNFVGGMRRGFVLSCGIAAKEGDVTCHPNEKIYNNTVVDTDVSFGVNGVAYGEGKLELKNNISWIQTPGVVGSAHIINNNYNAEGVTWSNNLYYGGPAVSGNAVTNAVFGDPKLAKTSGWRSIPSPFILTPDDFKLQVGSAAINKGTSLASSYNKDYFGTLRPQGTAWDIGAHEYTGSTPTYILGDLNKDGKVDIADYSMFIQDFGKTGTNLPADLNKNGQVEIGDYSIFISNFGKTS